MQQPVISVLLPVYNGSRYLREAIDSILSQTFTDFELVAVNDGSTDDSLDILRSYQDPRMVVVNHPDNKGIVEAMNAGLAYCTGKYIARMDSDDIAVPERFAHQLDYLETHQDTGVLDTVMAYIDEEGRPMGRTNSPIVTQQDIYQTLPKLNCLGHSSIMMRGDLLREYRYRPVIYEDYDLWLRMAANGVPIAKLATPLLLFRIHQASIVGTDQANKLHFYKIIRTKAYYLSRLTFAESLNHFNLRVRFWLLRDMAIHAVKTLRGARKAQ